jgi:hypothetical protein
MADFTFAIVVPLASPISAGRAVKTTEEMRVSAAHSSELGAFRA